VDGAAAPRAGGLLVTSPATAARSFSRTGDVKASGGAIRLLNIASEILTNDPLARVPTLTLNVAARKSPLTPPNPHSISGANNTRAYEPCFDNTVQPNNLLISGTTNDWSGGTRIERGRVVLGAANALPTSTSIIFGTTYGTSDPARPQSSIIPSLDLNGKDQT